MSKREEERQSLLPIFLDLLLCLGENAGAAELIPGLAKMSQAKAVIAPIDDRDHLPAGLKRQ
ncbi:unnamed protein product, partial [marine sediment metagenome]